MNVFDYLFATTQHLEKDFVLGPKETISFKKLHEDSLKIASYLKVNVGQNQNVVLISPNSVFFITVYLGILKSGNVCVPLNFSIEQDNLDFIIEASSFGYHIDINIMRDMVWSSQPKNFSVVTEKVKSFTGQGKKIKK